MSIDAKISQKGLFKKQLPLEVITGNALHYRPCGNSGAEYIVYNPKQLARGFGITCAPEEMKEITLSLPQPTTPQEIRDFYETLARITAFWNSKLTVNGSELKPSDIMADCEKAIGQNARFIRQVSQMILDGEKQFTIPAAIWSPTAGEIEAKAFLNDPDAFAPWLHGMQSADACYAKPKFFEGQNGIIGVHTITDNTPYILPVKPTVPFGIVDLSTGQPLQCHEWWVDLCLSEQPVGELPYPKFIDSLPQSNVRRFDETHILLSCLTEDEIKCFIEK